MNTKQLTFGFGERATRCSLCDRKLESGVCKWCFKGGLGDPPCPEMASWNVWRKSLERVLRRELERAGIDAQEEQCTVDAVFHDRGEVPERAALIARPYLARLCSEGRYNEARSSALLTHHLYNKLHKAFVVESEEPFLERIARLSKLSRSELIEHAKREEVRKHERAALAWHVEDICVIASGVVSRLRKEGVTKEQRSALEIALVVVERVGLDASLRLKREDFTHITLGIVGEELGKRGRKLRIAEQPSVKLRVDIGSEVDAEIEAIAVEDVARPLLRFRV